MPVDLKEAKALFEVLQSVVTISAVIMAGCWAFFMFVWKRVGYPNAELHHVVDTRVILSSNSNSIQYLVRVAIAVRNTSSVLLHLQEADVRIAQVLPLSDSLKEKLIAGSDIVEGGTVQVAFPPLGQRLWRQIGGAIEPGGIDRLIADFTVSGSVTTIEVYSHVQSTRRRNTDRWGWTLTTLHELKGERDASSTTKDC